MWYRGIGALGLILLVRPAHAQQQQDTTKHGWGIVYSSPRSRASSTSTTPSAAAPSAPAITPAAPAPVAQPPVTTLPTIRGSHYSGDAAAPPANGVYQGDRPAPVAAPVAAPAVADRKSVV